MVLNLKKAGGLNLCISLNNFKWNQPYLSSISNLSSVLVQALLDQFVYIYALPCRHSSTWSLTCSLLTRDEILKAETRVRPKLGLIQNPCHGIGSDSTNQRLYSELSLCSKQNAVRSVVTRRCTCLKFKLYEDTLFSQYVYFMYLITGLLLLDVPQCLKIEVDQVPLQFVINIENGEMQLASVVHIQETSYWQGCFILISH